MGTVSLNPIPMISGRYRLNIKRVSTKMLLANKISTSNMFFCVHQICKNFSSSLHAYGNAKNSGIVEKDLVSINSRPFGGLRIIDFFSGKKLLITGATGFRAKGTLFYFYHNFLPWTKISLKFNHTHARSTSLNFIFIPV